MNMPPVPTYSKRGVQFEVVEQGTIRIGGTKVYRPGADVAMTDSFAITTLQQTNGEWVRHPVEQQLVKVEGGKRRVIPIMIPYDDPDLVMQSHLTAFDKSACRVTCRSTTEGSARRRVDNNQVIDVPCSGPDSCDFAANEGIECKWFGRVRVHVDAEGSNDDPTSVFVLRSAGYNTLRGVEAALRQYHGLFNGNLRGIKFKLTLQACTTATSEWQTFEVVGLQLNGMTPAQAMTAAADLKAAELKAGLRPQALEQALKAGLENYELVQSGMEGLLAAEFFPAAPAAAPSPTPRQVASSDAWEFPGLELPKPKGSPKRNH